MLSRVAVVQLADGVYRVATAPADLVNSFVFAADDGSVCLIDAGFRRADRKIAAALRELGRRPEDVTHLLLTHAHMDHAGGADALLNEAVEVLAHTDDVSWLGLGREPRSDSSSLGGRLVNVVGRVWRRPWYTPVTVDRALVEGELLPLAGGIRVIHTPGHTPGHISLLHEPSGVLITGDAVMNVRGLRNPPRFFCANIRQEASTRQRLAQLDFGIAAFTHGAEIRSNARTAVEEFVCRDPRAA